MIAIPRPPGFRKCSGDTGFAIDLTANPSPSSITSASNVVLVTFQETRIVFSGLILFPCTMALAMASVTAPMALKTRRE